MLSVSDFVSVINQVLPEPHAGLLAGITFGTKTTLDKELYDQLVVVGILHIVALSGMNITILTNLVSKALLFFVPRRVATALTLFIVIWFVWFVGPSASIVRAAIMGVISLVAVIWGKQYWAFWSWTLAVVIMLALNFSWLFDISFQLSALATLGIILFGKSTKVAEVANENFGLGFSSLTKLNFLSPSINTRSQVNPDKILLASRNVSIFDLRFAAGFKLLYSLIEDDLRLTLAAQVFTIPLIFLKFHRISLISPLTNILIGWTIAPITIFGWLVAFLGWIWLPLGQVAGWISWVWLEYLLVIVRIFSKIPLASVNW